MKKRMLLLSLSIFYSCFSQAQSQDLYMTYDFTDKRDGETYLVIQIGKTKWFRENLRYESEYSFCPNIKTGKRHCGDGNFYPYTELDTICPTGWRVPTVQEWEAYYEHVRNAAKVDATNIKYDTLSAPESQLDVTNNTIIVTDTSEQTNLFLTDNLLNLKPLGWVQGKRRKNPGTITLWATNNAIKDKRYHLHIGATSYVKHSHKHHIDDKKRKRRKFLVRCVCEEDSVDYPE